MYYCKIDPQYEDEPVTLFTLPVPGSPPLEETKGTGDLPTWQDDEGESSVLISPKTCKVLMDLLEPQKLETSVPLSQCQDGRIRHTATAVVPLMSCTRHDMIDSLR